MSDREGPVTEAGFSVVEYETGGVTHDDQRSSTSSPPTTATTACRPSKLRDWLEARRQEAIRGWSM